jgi:hypothetical protein
MAGLTRRRGRETETGLGWVGWIGSVENCPNGKAGNRSKAASQGREERTFNIYRKQATRAMEVF